VRRFSLGGAAFWIALLVLSGGPCVSMHCCAQYAGYGHTFCSPPGVRFNLHDDESCLFSHSAEEECDCCCSKAHLPPAVRISSGAGADLFNGSGIFIPFVDALAGTPHSAASKAPLITVPPPDITLLPISSTVIVV
jgi:hypothetical protein